MKRKVIVTCAVNGAMPLSAKYPQDLRFPITPKEIAATVVEAAKAGAAVAHIHARDPETTHETKDVDIYREITDRIRESGIDIIINLTCGIGGVFIPDPDNEAVALPESDILSAEDRVRHIEACRPEICSLDVVTANQPEGAVDAIYMNTPRTLRAMAKTFQELGVKPEIEVFNPGDIVLANAFVDEGVIDDPPLYQFVLGVKWCAPATPEMIMSMRNMLPSNANWTAMGISRQQMPTAIQSVLMGGNIRVGLEDNLYLERGQFATNAQLVERAVTLIEGVGEAAASPKEARQILGINSPV